MDFDGFGHSKEIVWFRGEMIPDPENSPFVMRSRILKIRIFQKD